MLKHASTKQWVKQAETKLPAEPQALRVINQQLYCCCYGNGIVVFDSELQRQRNIQRPDMGYIRVYDIAVMSSGDTVVATRDGLLQNVIGKRIVRLCVGTNIWRCHHTSTGVTIRRLVSPYVDWYHHTSIGVTIRRLVSPYVDWCHHTSTGVTIRRLVSPSGSVVMSRCHLVIIS